MLPKLALASLVALSFGVLPRAAAAPDEEAVELVLRPGTPLRVALDQRVRVRRAGQPVTATVVEPVYAYDRIVVPAGAKVLGHLEKLERPSGGTRLRAMLAGDFSPPRGVVLAFNSLVLPGAQAIAIHTVVTRGAEDVALQVAGTTEATSVVARARREIAQRANQAASTVKRPGKMRRLKRWLRDAVLGALPLHPQFIREDTVYSVKLLAPLGFGSVVPAERAEAGVAPAPGSILTARLLTPLHSATTPRSTAIEAVVTRPVFSADQRLILPEGTRMTGEVTFARPARHFHRNGQLRVLFEAIQLPDHDPKQLRASLHSVEAARDARVAVDEEGGATIANSNARFAAPVLASLALAASLHRSWDYDTDGAGPEVQYGSTASHSAGGFFGLSLLGVGVAQAGRPAALALAIVGVARTAYGSVAGKGRDVSFPADTPIQVRLAPGPGPSPSPSPTRSPSP